MWRAVALPLKLPQAAEQASNAHKIADREQTALAAKFARIADESTSGTGRSHAGEYCRYHRHGATSGATANKYVTRDCSGWHVRRAMMASQCSRGKPA